MAHPPEFFTEIVCHPFQAEQLCTALRYQDVADIGTLNTQVHQGAEVIPVGQLLRKAQVPGGYGKPYDREMLPSGFTAVRRKKTDNSSFRVFITAVQQISHGGQVVKNRMKNCLFLQSEKISARRNISLPGGIGQFRNALFQDHILFIIHNT